MSQENKTVVVLGDAKCGMTSLLKKISGDRWRGAPDTTCPARYQTEDLDLSLQLIELKNYTKGRTYLVDMFTNMANVVMIIKDCSTSDNSENMLQQIQRIRSLRPNVPIVLATTKCDEGPVRKSDDGYSLFTHVSTSCKTDLGIDDLKKALFRASFPTEMKASERWYKVLLNWQGFQLVSGLSSNSKAAKTNKGGVQKKSMPCLARKFISTQSLDSSLNRPTLVRQASIPRSFSLRNIR